jgi:hypothetical protein
LVDPYRPKVIECYRLEQGAVLAESAQRLRDDHDFFGTVPLDNIQSNVAAAVDCVESTGDGRNSIGEVLVGHPDLAAKGAEAARHYSWIFNCAGQVVMIEDEPDICDSSGPVHLPDAAAALTRHDHVKVKCALMIEGNSGMGPGI